MIRVLFVEHKQIFGGGQVSLLSLLDRFDKKAVKAVVVCQPGAVLIGELKKRNINIYVFGLGEIRKGRRPGVILGNLIARIVPTLRLIRLISRERIDLVYTNGVFSLIASLLAAKLTGTPVVWSEHNITLPLDLETKLLIALADRIAVVTDVIRQQFLGLDPKAEKKIVVIYNGVDPSRFEVRAQARDKLRQELGLTEQHPVIGTVGRLSPEKGHRHFLQAAKIIKEGVPTAKFLIVGDGPMRTDLEAMAKEMGILEDVCFTGFREDVPVVLSLMDVFVLPSLEEAFGIAMLEAMAVGKPVIASNVGGVYEAVIEGETGFLVEPGDWQKMAKLAIGLLGDEEKRKRMGEKGRQLVACRYTLEATCAKTLELIQEVAEERQFRRKP